MEHRTVLYHHKDDEISITVEAGFENGSLVVEGYDIGMRVKEYWGDSDYEYSTTVAEADLVQLANALGVANDQESIVRGLLSRFNDNFCYSNFVKFLESHHIPSRGGSWT
ncbi:MAG: hypothetical protein U0289_16570 [Cyclobacteriaceae bacterium]|jgi:hypothetical protein|nr:hypothetical protein [Cytophagales bacterium]HNP77100.1 hypothetical protein [Cyclobacteriaceae bacterium]